MFALISELSSRGESWELQSRIDAEAGRAIYQSFARYRPVEAVDAAVEDEPEPDTPESPLHDVETAEGLAALKRILKRIEPADAFATILRSVIREILPNVMLDVAMKPPG
jgi:hypothetical protein